MSDVKLLPCPFCGGEIKLDEDDFYMFCCDTCGAGITFAHELEDGTAEDCTKEESIESWNTRKPMERIVEQLEDISNVLRRIPSARRYIMVAGCSRDCKARWSR